MSSARFIFGSRAALGAATTAAGVAASSSPASARAPPAQVAPRGAASHASPCQSAAYDGDEWLLTDFSKDVLLFNPYRPEEIDSTISELKSALAMSPLGASHSTAPPTPLPTHPDHPAGTLSPQASACVSEGGSSTPSIPDTEADIVIQSTYISHQALGQGQGRGAKQGLDGGYQSDLLLLTSRLLRSPGLQREVVKVMLEDVEVRDLMLRQSNSRNLDAYLQAAGITNTHLLEQSTGSESSRSGEGEEEEFHGEDPLSKIMRAALGCINSAGDAFAFLSGWLRDRVQNVGRTLNFLFFGGESAEEQRPAEGQQAGGEGSSGQGQQGPARGRKILEGAMVVGVVVFCMLLARRPVVRLCTGVVGAAAAAKARKS